MALAGGGAMIRHSLAAAGLTALVVLAVPAQSQVPLAVSDVGLDTWNGNLRCLPRNGCSLLGEGWSPGSNIFHDNGDSWSFDFGTLWVDGGVGGDRNGGVSVSFDFIPEASVSDSATAKYATAFGVVTGGTLKWDSNQGDADGLSFEAGGADFLLTLDDIKGVEWGDSVTLRGTITMLSHLSDPPNDEGARGVPEPASWTMTLGGFGLVGGALRAGRRASVRFA